MRIDELSTLGYCCTGRVEAARQPMTTMARLTTTARTGCRMNVSVKLRRISLRSGFDSVSGGVAGEHHQDLVAQFERARGGNEVTRGETLINQDRVANDFAALYRALVRAQFAVLFLDEQEDVI